MAQKIIIDTDPGIDDAMAIHMALADPRLEIVGMTTVFGNVTSNRDERQARRKKLDEIWPPEADPVWTPGLFRRYRMNDKAWLNVTGMNQNQADHEKVM